MRLTMPLIALRNLTRRPLRSIFTIAGVAIGMAAVIAIGGVSRGLEKAWERALAARGTDVVVSSKSGGLMAGVFDGAVKDELAAMDGVADVTNLLWQILSVEDASMIVVSGREWGGFAWTHLRLVDGRMPVDSSEKAVVLGVMAAEILNKKPGDTLQIELEEFTVVGIVDGGAVAENGSVVLSLGLFQQLTGNPGKVTFVNIRLKDPGNEKAAKDLCQSISCRFPNLRATPAGETLGSNRAFEIARAGSMVTSMLALFVGGFGVMNTMMMSVFERTGEIAVLSALGWKRRRILGTILIESILLSLLGFTTGLATGLLLLWGFGSSLLIKGQLEPNVGLNLILIAFGTAVGIGAIGGLWPAWKGARLSPAEALRAP